MIHWLVVAITIILWQVSSFFAVNIAPFLLSLLYIIDYIPIYFAGLIQSASESLFGPGEPASLIYATATFVLVTLQWMLVGSIITSLRNRHSNREHVTG